MVQLPPPGPGVLPTGVHVEPLGHVELVNRSRPMYGSRRV